MSSAFDTAFAASGVPPLMDQFGTTVMHTTAGGTATSLTAMMGEESSRESDDPDGRRAVRTRECTLTTDPDGTYGGVAAVALNDTITYGGVVYAVEEIQSEDANLVTVNLVRREDIQRSRQNYRRRGR